MCLAVPGRVVEWIEQHTLFARAIVEFSGIRTECQMACVPDAQVGEYVVVHAGIAISKVDETEAQRAIEAWSSQHRNHELNQSEERP